MPRLDIIHNAVKNALMKDGWMITDDPYIIQYRRTILYADLGAERPIAAERMDKSLSLKLRALLAHQKYKI